MIDSHTVESPAQLLPSEPGSVRLARAWVDGWLTTWALERLSAAATLVTSELVTNAIQHGQGKEIALQLTRDGSAVTIRVGDDNPDPPLPRQAGTESEAGRGLHLVAACSSSWGWHPENPDGPGKYVWALLE